MNRNRTWLIAVLAFCVVAVSLGLLLPRVATVPPTIRPLAELPEDVNQVVLVRPGDSPTKVTVGVYTVLRPSIISFRSGWHQILRSWPGVIGRNGFAAPGTKREGDGKTPSGVYPLRRTFGYEKGGPTDLDHRQATPNDYWIDDPKSPDYNRWVTGPKPALSHEVLRRDDNLYKLGAVIEYNTEPVVPGHGSAIFLHVWAGPDSTTAGCVAMAEKDLSMLLFLLRKTDKPVIVLNP